MHKAAHIRTV